MIQVTVGDCQWLVTRRYRQFAELHELVRDKFKRTLQHTMPSGLVMFNNSGLCHANLSAI